MAPATLGYLTELSPILVIKITWLKRCNFPFNRVTVNLEKPLNGLLKKLMQLTCSVWLQPMSQACWNFAH